MNKVKNISEIAHAWKSPLMELSALIVQIEIKAKIDKNLDVEETLEIIEDIHGILGDMASKVDDYISL